MRFPDSYAGLFWNRACAPQTYTGNIRKSGISRLLHHPRLPGCHWLNADTFSPRGTEQRKSIWRLTGTISRRSVSTRWYLRPTSPLALKMPDSMRGSWQVYFPLSFLWPRSPSFPRRQWKLKRGRPRLASRERILGPAPYACSGRTLFQLARSDPRPALYGDPHETIPALAEVNQQYVIS